MDARERVDGLNRWLTLAANIGVVASIIFLGLELRQTREAVVAATYHERATLDEEWQKWVSESEFLIPAILRWRETPFDSLPAEDQARLRTAGLGAMYRLDGLHFQHELGLMDEEYYSTVFQRMLEIWVPRWRETGILDNGLLEVRPSFRSAVTPYLDGPLIW